MSAEMTHGDHVNDRLITNSNMIRGQGLIK